MSPGQFNKTMKRVLTLLILTIATTTLRSQPTETEFYQAIVKLETTSEVESYKDKFGLKKDYEEQLNFGVTQTNWSAVRGKKSLETQLVTLSVDGQIFYSEFYRPKLSEDFESWAYDQIQVNIDSTRLKSVTDVKDVVMDFADLGRDPYRSTFGYACYATASMPEEGKRMLKLVQNKDSAALSSWLKSINPVKQVYAYLGLKLLQEVDSLELPDEIIRSMSGLETSSALVYSCSGCTIWDHVTIKQHLTPENVAAFIERRKSIK
jgi:hypothetical protein